MSDLITLKSKETELYASSKGIREFLGGILDEASFVETDVFLSGENLIYDSVPYGEGVITGYATIGGYPVYVVAQNGEALKGSFGEAHARKILKCIKRARKNELPLISILDSAGIRAGEGLEVLDAFAEVFAALNEFRYYAHHVAIIRGTAVGLMASYAAMADFVFMRGKATLSVNPPMVLAAKAKKDGKYEDILGAKVFAASKLGAFRYETPADVSDKIIKLFSYLDEELVDSSDDPNRQTPSLNNGFNKDELMAALADEGKYLEVFDGFCPSVFCALTSVNSLPVGVIVTNADGASPRLNKYSIKKIRRFIKILDAYDIPLINLVDSEGIDSTLEEEQAGFAVSAAKLLKVVTECSSPKISVVVGKAIGFAYTALCSKPLGYDFVAAFPSASIASVNAETAINVFYDEEIRAAKDSDKARKALAEKYRNDMANPFISAKGGSVDNIIEPAMLRPYVASVLTMTAE